jgi:uncharacterized membrane protein YeaQ/YmgE (transglycosylase-associated protein family)
MKESGNEYSQLDRLRGHSSIITKSNDQMGCLTNIIAGILGAVVGGWVFGIFGGTGVSGFNLPSLLVAIVGAVIVLALVNFFFGRRS